ncbi:IS66 family insertion sequence element accessory protein TnpA [Bremerella cremea]|uniref:IS66 family insertion sequence element accessory protein TnpA n=1 Tax=Bremerella cremea TaxID=1031537 RepID=UPI003CC7E1B5
MAKGPRRDLSKERGWREVISGQAKSGLSVRAFCLQRGVSEASFYAWRRELARRDDVAGEASPRADRPSRAWQQETGLCRAGQTRGRTCHGWERHAPT